MKKKILISISIVAITLISFLIFGLIKNNIYASPKGQLSYKEKKQDAEYLLTFLEENYPYFDLKKRTTGYDFLNHKQELINKISKAKNDKEFYVNVYETMKLLQNSHSIVAESSHINLYKNSSDQYGKFNGIIDVEATSQAEYWDKIYLDLFRFPDIKCQYIDGNYVVSSSLNSNIQIGNIISEVNNIPVEEYLKSNMDKYTLKYDFSRKTFYTDTLFLEFGVDENRLLNVSIINGDIKNAQVHFSKYDKDKLSKLTKGNSSIILEVITSKIIEEDNIAYLKVNSMSDNKIHMDEVDIFFKSVTGYKNLIIDIRGNGGGSDLMINTIIKNLNSKDDTVDNYYCYRNSNFMNELIKDLPYSTLTEIPTTLKNIPLNGFKTVKYLRTLPFDKNAFAGNVYILTDKVVYSSSEQFSNIIKQYNLGKLIGETTGGDGIGSAPVINTLPNSKMCILIPSSMGIDLEGNINEEVHTSPDYYVEQNINDYLKALELNITDIECSKYDTVFNKCIDIIKNNTLPK
ncbi:MAG: S41 family peptidase [Clostridium sp.]|uniref:S41 family peptidase n=1 Tax=Clostridium sp. TaxID=1506 RepID=UPI003054AB48